MNQNQCPNPRHRCSNDGRYTTEIFEDRGDQRFKTFFCQVCGEKWGRTTVKKTEAVQ